MIEKGVLPKGTQLTPLNPLPEDMANTADYVRPWDSLNADEKKLFSRLAEVYAAFSEYTDVQIGRIIDYLQESGQLENTIVLYAADNGASGEGSPNGSVNENKFFNGYPDELAENMKYLDVLGGPDTYEHFPTGWAAAFSTPFQMFKRYAEYSGGTSDPLVISWPKGIKARGEIRNQYHHSTTSCRRSWTSAGWRCRRSTTAWSSSRSRRVDALHLRCDARCADAEEAPVLRHARHARDLGGRLAGRRRARPDLRQGPLRQGRSGSSTTWTWTAPSRRTWPRRIPRSSRR